MDERIGDRCYGWGLIGLLIKLKRLLKKLEQGLILLAYSLYRYYRPLIVKGAITAQIFED
jgi:hypothetical protein